MGVPLSTLSDWFCNQDWSSEIAVRLSEKARIEHKVRILKLNKVRGDRLNQVYHRAELEAVADFAKLKYHPLFVAGLMIYWGEGNKLSKSRVSIANTEPAMINVFVDFLINVCQLHKNKIRVWLLLYPDLDDNKCRSFWIKNAGLEENSFTKSMVIKGKQTNSRRLTYGVCNLGVSSAYLKRKILVWIDLLAKDLIAKEYTRA